jgi:TamB, inner membrane protein subunit of TAM complex
VAGVLRATGGRVEAPLLGAVASDASLDARFTASRLELTRFSGKSGQGSISGSGTIDLSWERGFPMDIRMVAKDAAILGRDDLTATGSGNIRLATDEYGGVVSGNLTLARADYKIGRTAVADVPVLAVTEKNTRLVGRRSFQYVAPTRWLFNLAIKADRRLLVSGMGIASEWQADVRVRGAATAPELFGRVQLVRGDYEFAGKRFQLTRGDIRFVGAFPPDPIIAVTAENNSNGFSAFLNVEGTAQKPQIKFSSVPALPEDEVLSRVLFGSSVTDLSAPEAIQLAAALAGLRGGGGFNPIGAVSKGLGIDRLRILPADATTGRKTTVAAGQYVGRNIYVELATDAQGYTATSIEIGLTRTLSVLSSVATLGGTSGSVACAGSAIIEAGSAPDQRLRGLIGHHIGGKAAGIGLGKQRRQARTDGVHLRIHLIQADLFAVIAGQIFGHHRNDAPGVDDIIGRIKNAARRQPGAVFGRRQLIVGGSGNHRHIQRGDAGFVQDRTQRVGAEHIGLRRHDGSHVDMGCAQLGGQSGSAGGIDIGNRQPGTFGRQRPRQGTAHTANTLDGDVQIGNFVGAQLVANSGLQPNQRAARRKRPWVAAHFAFRHRQAGDMRRTAGDDLHVMVAHAHILGGDIAAAQRLDDFAKDIEQRFGLGRASNHHRFAAAGLQARHGVLVTHSARQA